MTRTNYYWILIVALSQLVTFCSNDDEENQITQCVPLSFQILSEDQLEYRFKADFSNIESTSYSWVLDDKIMEVDGTSGVDILDNTFSVQLEPGTHEVCIIRDSECIGASEKFCKQVSAKTKCPKLSYAREGVVLKADFKGVNAHPAYTWMVDGKESKVDGVAVKGNHTFDLTTLGANTYNICIVTSDCDTATWFCEDIEVTNSNLCPTLSFVRRDDLLIPDFEGYENFNTYSWFVDGVERDQDGKSNNGDHQFDLTTVPNGTYNICIKSDDCDANATFCRKITIGEDPDTMCPLLTYEQRGNDLYANFDNYTSFASYSWYIDNVEKEKDGISVNGDHKFNLAALSDGTYSICIKSDTCEADKTFCREITINNNTGPTCPKFSFVKENNQLKANFPDFTSFNSYTWYVNGVERKKDGTQHNGNHQFNLNDLTAGSYTICIKSDDCDASSDFCDTIVIRKEDPQDCTRMSFKTNGTVAIANFDRVDASNTSYGWYVNGLFQEKDGNAHGGDNQFDISYLQSGSYEICILPTDCDRKQSFCLEMSVGDSRNTECPKLLFTKNRNKLKADFKGIENHKFYIWAVNGKDVKDDGTSVNGNNELDISNFQKGKEYKVCIYSPGCEVKNYYCRRVTR